MLAALAIPAPAQAVTQQRLSPFLGADMCKLSVPTIDSKVRPRATGFRNEGTSNVFVICTLHVDNGPGSASIPLQDAGLLVRSVDGVSREVKCTGVNGFPEFTTQQFVAKTATTGAQVQLWWTQDDFGSTTGIPTTGVFSITCLLPPNMALDMGLANMYEDVGA